MNRRLVVSGLFFGLLVGPIAYAVFSEMRETRTQALLEEIDRAEREMAYSGRRTMSVAGPSGRYTTVLNITSAGEDRKEIEFVETRIDGAPQKNLPKKMLHGPFDGGMPMFFRPSKGGKRPKFMDLGLVTKNYSVTITGQRELAGRTGDVIELKPRTEGRSSYRIVADTRNRFPLAFAVLNAEGREIFSFEFETVDFSPALPEELLRQKPKRGGMPDWVSLATREIGRENLSKNAGFNAFVPKSLPRGFQLMDSEIVHFKLTPPKDLPFIPKIDTTVLHLSYTDGLAIYTLIQFPANDEFWKQIKNLLPGLKDAGLTVEERSGAVIARKITHPAGVGFQLELQGTVVIAAGNISAQEMEASLETLEQR